MNPTLAGAALGLCAGLGVLLVLGLSPWLRRPGLEQRLAPYVRDALPRSGLLHDAARGQSGLAGALGRLLAPVMSDAARWLEGMSPGSAAVRRRLDQLGGDRTVEQFRAEQVVWGAIGAGAGACLAVFLAAGRAGPVLPLVGLIVVGGLIGVAARDRALTRQVRRREARMLAEFPAVAELLALSVGAGEGAVGALERVARVCHGELPAELARMLGETRTGTSLVQGLEGLGARTGLPTLARFADGVAVAIERGTPLGDVLRAQARDVREATRRQLIESGGKREIAMMIPVVFLVLPVTVLFIVYPGLAVLDLKP